MLAALFLIRSPSPSPSTSISCNAASPSSPFSASSSCSNSKPPIRVPAQKFPSKFQETSPSPELNSPSNPSVKLPTAPWMKGPLLLPPQEVLDLKRARQGKSLGDAKAEKADRALTEKLGGVRGDKVVQKIVQSIERLKRTRQLAECSSDSEEIELGLQLQIPFDQVRGEGKSDSCGKLPWVKDERVAFRRTKKEKVVTAAELTLDKELLARLRTEARKMRKWVKVMKIGVSEEVVDEINRIWRRNELAMVKFHIPLCRNMDRAQEIVEMKTGGLVVWRRKDTLVIYRGVDYCLKKSSKRDAGLYGRVGEEEFRAGAYQQEDAILMESPAPVNGSLYERESDRLLDGLGPRFEDWWMRKPLPVDADLLPEVVLGFRPPLRMCPPNERSKLTDDELTYLRKLAHPLPTHFVLGRNRRLQGLAAAIINLWEKSLIAKIAVKWGVPNTNNEEMANELKHLTGGVLLLRNKFYIILFRGKDFLPSGIATSIAERELNLKRYHLHEEDARWKASETIHLADEPLPTSSTTGTLSDFQEILTEHCNLGMGHRGANVQVEAEIEKLRKELKKQGRRLFILKSKMNISEKWLEKLNSGKRPAEWDPDRGMMTEEERECFRKIGLRMNDYLVLGRRGIFDGVIEALHQHWKHREVVKVITMQRMYAKVIETANLLEAESGGILVSVDEQKEGHSIIIYRGKNYRRPLKLPTEHLLTKRNALLRSLEMQRFGSLKFFVRRKQQAVSDLTLKLVELENQLPNDEKLNER